MRIRSLNKGEVWGKESGVRTCLGPSGFILHRRGDGREQENRTSTRPSEKSKGRRTWLEFLKRYRHVRTVEESEICFFRQRYNLTTS